MLSEIDIPASLGSPAIYHSPHNNNVVLFGEILADIFPDKTVLGGAPFNAARHLKAFGMNPFLISRVGNDPLRDEIMDVMTQNKMDMLGIQCNKIHPTGQVQVHLEKNGHHFDILPNQAYDFIHPAIARMTTLTVNPSLVYFGTLAQRNPISERALKTLIRSTDAPKFLDLNLRAPWYDAKTVMQSLHYANIFKLNDVELNVLAEMLDLSGVDGYSHASELIRRFNLDQVIVTCGEKGAWYLDRSGSMFEASSTNLPVKIVDTVGAGDAFAAVCIQGLLRRWPINLMLQRANDFASAICRIRGAIPEHSSFYAPFINEWGNI